MPRKNKGSKTPIKELVLNCNQSKAYKMRLEGATYQTIADEMHISTSTAYALVAEGAKAVLEYNQLDLKGLVLMQGERIEGILATLYPQATTPGEDQHDAIDRCVKLFERQARLFGLDARPDAQAVTVSPFVFNINFGDAPKEVRQVDIIATSPDE